MIDRKQHCTLIVSFPARHGQPAAHEMWTDPTGFPVPHTSPSWSLRPDALALAKQPFEKGSGRRGKGGFATGCFKWGRTTSFGLVPPTFLMVGVWGFGDSFALTRHCLTGCYPLHFPTEPGQYVWGLGRPKCHLKAVCMDYATSPPVTAISLLATLWVSFPL